MPSVLIIDDSEDFRLLAAQYIAIEWPDALVEDWDPGTQSRPPHYHAFDLVLLDHRAGQQDGVQWLQDFARRPDCPPVIFLTEHEDRRLSIKAIALGAHNCLPKDSLSKARLITAVKAALSLKPDNAEPALLKSERTLLLSSSEPGTVTGSFELEAPGGGTIETVRINGYRLVRKIGVGGMSTVFLAHYLPRGITVVLKILEGKLCQDSEFLNLFVREYSLISHLDSPYVVKIYDQGFTDSHVFISMEHFSGGDLRDRLRTGTLAPEQVMVVFRELVTALAVIHAHGVVHRDLKPQNVMFRENGSLALVDFGIAKRLDQEATLSGLGGTPLLGTPYYMSPEQCEGVAADHRSDLYSAGTIFYEMLTGSKLFTGSSVATVMGKHLWEPVPYLPRRLSAYQRFLDRMLAKPPADRYQNASELLDDLEAAH